MTATASSLSQRAVDFASRLRWANVPPAIQTLARLHLIDALGVGVGAASVPRQRKLMQALTQGRSVGVGATVLGWAGAVDGPTAALLNGTAIHSLEYDDTHMRSIVHGSAVIVPAALAAAEQHGLSLEATLALVVAGWEVLVRIGEASPGGFQRRGFQVTSVGGVLVAAMIASVAAGASAEQAASAMGIAGSQAGGIFEFLSNGSNVKALHPGWAAHSGLWAASCAAGGMTGPLTVLEGRFGLYAAYAGDTQAPARLSDALADLGQRWVLAEAAFKLFPCCHYIHPYIEGLQQLLPTIGSPDAVESVRLLVAQGAADVICEPWDHKLAVTTGTQAKYSLPYCLARVLLGRPVDVAAMTADEVDPEARALARRFEWAPWTDSGFPGRFGADLRVRLRDGRELHAQVAQVRGSVERPVAEADVRAKFLANVAAGLVPGAGERAWQAVMAGGSLDELRSALRCTVE